MPRSIKIYKFYTSKSIKNSYVQLQNNKMIDEYVTVGGKKYFPKIKLQKENKEGYIKGMIKIPKRKTIIMNEVMEELIDHKLYSFYLNKQKNIAIIQSRDNKPFKLLQKILKNEAIIETIKDDKNKIIEIADQIKNEFGAIIRNPRFEFDGVEGYKGFSNSAFTLAGNKCATSIKNYSSMLKEASVYKPIFRILEIDGIIENDGNGKLLKLSNQFVFSMYIKLEFDLWIEFINKYIFPIVEKW